MTNGECYFGSHGKAGSFGLIPTATGKHGKWILEALSLSSLRRFLWSNQLTWPDCDEAWQDDVYIKAVSQWSNDVAHEVASALAAVVALYDPEAILIGGRLPTTVLTALITELEQVVAQQSTLPIPPIRHAQTGQTAGVLGAAVLPLYEIFAPQKNLLLLSSKDKQRNTREKP